MAFQGSLKELPLPDIIQLVAVSGKTGVFQLERDEAAGEIYLRNGQIVHARSGSLEGEEAVYELAVWSDGDFVFTPGRVTDVATIQKSNTNLLMEAARRIDEWQVLSKKIPSTRMVPVFTEKGGVTSVSLNPQEWMVTRRIDERRSVEEIAIGLGVSPFEVAKILYGLITSGLVELKDEMSRTALDRLQSLSQPEVESLAERIHGAGRELMSNHQRAADLESSYRQSRAELAAGRRVDALLDLIRNEERVLTSALGPAPAARFLERVSGLLVGGGG